MVQKPLDGRPSLAGVRRNSRTQTATIVVACVVLAANVLLLAVAALDRSWGAFAIVIVVGPITNGILLLLSLACIPIVKSSVAGGSIKLYLAAAIGLPLAAIPIDFFIMSAIGMYGG